MWTGGSVTMNAYGEVLLNLQPIADLAQRPNAVLSGVQGEIYDPATGDSEFPGG